MKVLNHHLNQTIKNFFYSYIASKNNIPYKSTVSNSTQFNNSWSIKSGMFIDYYDHYYDTPRISQYSGVSKLKGYFLSFVDLDKMNKDNVSWGGREYVFDSCYKEVYIANATNSAFAKNDINYFRKMGGEIVLSFGGRKNEALIESKITDIPKLVETYNQIIKNYQLKAINFYCNNQALSDLEGVDRHNIVIKAVKEQNLDLQLAYTLEMTKEPGLSKVLNQSQKDFLKKLYDNGINVSLINGFIESGKAEDNLSLFEETKDIVSIMHNDLSQIWKEWSVKETWSHIGVCPVFGKNPSGKFFTIEDQKSLNEWAQPLGIGCLNGWDAVRDHNPSLMDLPSYEAGQFGKVLSEYIPVELDTELAGHTNNFDELM